MSKRHLLICLLLWAYLSALSPLVAQANLGTPFGRMPSTRLPGAGGEDPAAPPPFWQANYGYSILAQRAPETGFPRALARGSHVRTALWPHQEGTLPELNGAWALIDRPSTVSGFIGRHANQYLDIPPPTSLASL